MFDFEELAVYKKAKSFNSGIRDFMKNVQLDRITNDQLRRAAFSVVLNIAEGTGRFSKADRCNFYIISRSSIFECVAILDVLLGEGRIDKVLYDNLYQLAEEISKILFSMIKQLKEEAV